MEPSYSQLKEENERYKIALYKADKQMKHLLRDDTLTDALKTIATCSSDPFAVQTAFNALNSLSDKE